VADYRWNVTEFATAYDAAAEHIHPRYVEMQLAVLDLLPFATDAEILLVDAGGGSGRLIELFLDRFARATAIIVDQSETFLAIAERRLARFGGRAECRLARLQNDWTAGLPGTPDAVVSMSAIHHLDPAEKLDLYGRLHDALALRGVLLNGDEVRPADDAEYLARCRWWAEHMHRVSEAGLVPAAFRPAMLKWEERNVTRFGQPRVSGDDCHETVETQLGYFRAAGFARADCPWQKEMWAILRGVK